MLRAGLLLSLDPHDCRVTSVDIISMHLPLGARPTAIECLRQGRWGGEFAGIKIWAKEGEDVIQKGVDERVLDLI